jgi:hypothetical protein
MGQPGVTASAVLVPDIERRFCQLAGVAILASPEIGCLPHEVVRSVTALAVYARVKRYVLVGSLMATATGTRLGLECSFGMWIVTAHAATGRTEFRMIGVHGGVALGAGLRGAAAHVVGGVAIRTLLVAGRLAAAEDREALVAGAAWRRLVFRELVRTMATHALPMAGVEESGLGHDRLLLRVTRSARGECIRGRCVLLLVASGAGLND